MDRLWTPWRMEYVKGAGSGEGCVFCDLPAAGSEHDVENLILIRGDAAFLIMNRYPYNAGHLMVSPYRHGQTYEALTPAEHAELAVLTSRAIRALTQTYRPDGFNMGINQGRAAGAGIADHLHSHIVPRWVGDTNYMTTVGGAKVLPETLSETYATLSAALNGA